MMNRARNLSDKSSFVSLLLIHTFIKKFFLIWSNLTLITRSGQRSGFGQFYCLSKHLMHKTKYLISAIMNR